MTIAEYQCRDDALTVMKRVVAELDRVAPGRYTSTMVNQLVYTPFQGMSLLHEHVIPEIAHLENSNRPSKTGKAKSFKREQMKGLWKKHFYLPQFFTQNVKNAWGLSPESRSTSFEDTFARSLKEYNAAPTEERAAEFSSFIAQSLIDGANARPLTGEYVVFEKHENKNYYLCIARHSDDDAILRWAGEARKDFQFLNNLNENEGAQ